MAELIRTMKSIHDTLVDEPQTLDRGFPKKHVLSSGIVFRKDVFFDILSKLDEFIVFRNIDADGWTHSSRKLSRPWEVAIFLSVLIAFGCVPVSLVFWLTGAFISMGWTSIVVLPVAGFVLIFISAIVSNDAFRDFLDRSIDSVCRLIWSAMIGRLITKLKLRNSSHADVVRFFFPDGQDSVRDSRSHQFKLRVKFPLCPTPVHQEINRVIKAGKKMRAQMLTVAHRDAVGINLNEIELVQAADPFVCLETSDSIIVFPSTSWGGDKGQAELIERLERSFAGISLGELN